MSNFKIIAGDEIYIVPIYSADYILSKIEESYSKHDMHHCELWFNLLIKYYGIDDIIFIEQP